MNMALIRHSHTLPFATRPSSNDTLSARTAICSSGSACRHRQHLQAPLQRHIAAAGATEHSSAGSADDDGPPEFAEDLTRDFRGSEAEWVERRKREQQAARQSWLESLNFQPESLQGGGGQAADGSLGGKLKNGVDKVLIADFFFVCLSLVALLLAVAVQLTTSSTALTDLWLAAWPIIFQPAIGILMAGALFSGLAGWVRSDVIKD